MTKLNAAGTALVYSTYLGGTGVTSAMASPWTLPATPMSPAYRLEQLPDHRGGFPDRVGQDDAFVTKLDSTGTALVYSTYLGGNGD